MANPENLERYSSVAIVLHWLIAAALIFNICLGLYCANIPDSDPNHFVFVQIHKSVGLSVLVLSVLRLIWRLSHPAPPLPAWMPWSLRALARTTHVLLYVLIIGIPLSGWAYVSASPLGLPTRYFGLFTWPNLPFFDQLTRAQKNPLHHEVHSVHTALAYAAIALITIHVAGALFHQFMRRDRLMARMWWLQARQT